MISFCIFLFSFLIVFLYDFYNSPKKLQDLEKKDEIKKDEIKNIFLPFLLTCFNSFIQSITIDYYTIHKLQSNFTLYNSLLSFVVYLILTDFYFYVTHRISHSPLLYKYIHKIHHKYTSPSIYASYYEHPLEHLLVWSMPYIILPHFVPINNFVYWSFVFYTSLLSIVGHSGNDYKLNIWYSFNFTGKKDVYYYYTHSYHHDLHHLKTNCNYSLYFTYLDRFFNTLYKNYDVYVIEKLE